MLRKLASIAVKIALSLIAITAFLMVSARLPFFRGTTPTFMALAPPDAATATPGGGAIPGAITFAGGSDRFEGTFFGADSGSGFRMIDRDVPGDCADAGRRYLAVHCPDCVVTAADTGSEAPATLVYLRPDGQVGTIFRDCSERVSDVLVRVPQLTFTDDRLTLQSGDGTAESGSPVPLLTHGERVSSMTLGTWAIAVDDVGPDDRALQAMGRLLQRGGWREQPQAGKESAADNQRVFVRGNAQSPALCVVTLNRADDGFQLVTMMNI